MFCSFKVLIFLLLSVVACWKTGIMMLVRVFNSQLLILVTAHNSQFWWCWLSVTVNSDAGHCNNPFWCCSLLLVRDFDTGHSSWCIPYPLSESVCHWWCLPSPEYISWCSMQIYGDTLVYPITLAFSSTRMVVQTDNCPKVFDLPFMIFQISS